MLFGAALSPPQALAVPLRNAMLPAPTRFCAAAARECAWSEGQPPRTPCSLKLQLQLQAAMLQRARNRVWRPQKCPTFFSHIGALRFGRDGELFRPAPEVRFCMHLFMSAHSVMKSNYAPLVSYLERHAATSRTTT